MSDDEYLFDNRAEQAGDRFDSLAAMFDPITRTQSALARPLVEVCHPQRRPVSTGSPHPSSLHVRRCHVIASGPLSLR